jgi:hypothetical protein
VRWAQGRWKAWWHLPAPHTCLSSCPRWDALPSEWRDALLVKKEDGEFW